LKIHPNETTLEEFLLSLDGGRREVLWHLLWCPSCRSRLFYLPRQPGPVAEVLPGSGAEPRYRRAVEEGWRLGLERADALERERDEALGLFVELTEQPAERREALLGSSGRFHTWGVFELLVERSLEAAPRDPAWAEELGLLAVRLAERLDAGRYTAALIADLRARAWAHVGNACRVRFDFAAAEDAFRHAAATLKEGTGDPLERALVLDLRASLRRDQRRFDEAFRFFQRAATLFRRLGDRHRAGRTLVNLSILHNQTGKPEKGIPLLVEALELIDPEQEPRLLLCAHHNLITSLADAGRSLEAQGRYRDARPLYRSFPDAWTQNRRKWVKAKIANGLEQFRQAESLFLAARDGFLAEGAFYDVALVSLELATLYAEQGRTAELKELAAQMLPVFQSGKIHREALAALAFWQQAVEAERAGLEVVSRVAGFLRRAQHDPEVVFETGE
jgi:tetratricopeptide (TPR) repeat protein